MYTPVDIVNIGLSKIGAARIRRMDGARTSAEVFCATNYPHWVISELAKHRWVFASSQLTLVQYERDENDPQTSNIFSLPTNVVRVIREPHNTWKQEGRTIRSDQEMLNLDVVLNVDTYQFDPLFVEVLACRVAKESAEYLTQSNTKKATAESSYDKAISDARKYNGFVRGPERVVEDRDYSFLTERYRLM